MTAGTWPFPRVIPDQFHQYWHLERKWVEPPNMRRGGYSGVLRCRTPPGSPVERSSPAYIKVQASSTYRDVRFLGWRIPTLRREQRQLKRAARAGVRVPRLLFYGERGRDAVLVLEAIEQCQPLDEALRATVCEPTRRRSIMQALTAQLLRLHGARIQHGALYPKHILVTWSADRRVASVHLIDFEKARRRWPAVRGIRNDLNRLFRRCVELTQGERIEILDSYRPLLGEPGWRNFQGRFATGDILPNSPRSVSSEALRLAGLSGPATGREK